MELTLDGEACMGHGRCYSTAPELFESDEAGHAVLLVSEVPEGLQDAARTAQKSCPERAISPTP